MLDVAEPGQKVFTIPYAPRAHFRRLHKTHKRFMAVVAHRRAGKTVALANHLIRAALTNTRQFPAPRYAYVGPSFTQAKDLVWGYFKHYLNGLEGVSFSESELTVTLPNGAKISLYGGSAAYERMRGLYFDGVVLDEYAMLAPQAWGQVIRPTLADYKGWAIVSGTSDGGGHFTDFFKQRANDEAWETFIIPVTETDALNEEEVQEMRSEMTTDEFDREMMCSFDAPVPGAYYAELMNDAEFAPVSRINSVPWDPAARVIACWDLGISDDMSIWLIQRVGREFHVIDFIQDRGKPLGWYVDEIKNRGYRNVAMLMPHDVGARELQSGITRKQHMMDLGCDVYQVPIHKVEDGIDAVRRVLPICWFDRDKTLEGRKALKAYRSGLSDKLGFTRPLHNWASHAADAFRTFAMGYEQVIGWSGAQGQPLRRKIRGLAR